MSSAMVISRTAGRRARPPRGGTCAGRRVPGPRSSQAASGGDTRAGPSPRANRRGTASSFPQAPVLYFGEVDLELVRTGRARDPPPRLAVGIDPLVKALEVVEVGREQALDQLGGDFGEIADPNHGASEQQHGEVRLVLAHLDRAQRLDLVAGRRQAHDAVAMDGAGAVDQPAGECERVFRLHYVCASSPTGSRSPRGRA